LGFSAPFGDLSKSRKKFSIKRTTTMIPAPRKQRYHFSKWDPVIPMTTLTKKVGRTMLQVSGMKGSFKKTSKDRSQVSAQDLKYFKNQKLKLNP
jgi:hypothetical protein